MKASAEVSVISRNGCTVIDGLRSEPPIALRQIHPSDVWTAHPSSGLEVEPVTGVTVAIVGSAAGPVGGDRLGTRIDVGAGAALCLRNVATTMVWPGPTGAPSMHTITIEVARGARLRWCGQPILVVRGAHHTQSITIDLAEDATLDLVEEIALGRSGEAPGTLDTRLRVVRSGAPLLDQRQVFDPTDPSWSTTAGVGGHSHVVQQLRVGPPPAPASSVTEVGPLAAAARFPLAGDAELAVALGADRCAALDALCGPN